MTKLIMQKRIINKISKDSYRKHLSIQFSLDGFSFCISNFLTKEIQHFGGYIFDKSVTTPEFLLKEITNVINENSLFNQNFEAVSIIHQNSLSVFVPTPLFNQNELKTYLDYNIKTLSDDFITFDSLSQLDIKNVYVPYVNLNNFFFQKFGEFEYKHHATVLVDKLISYSKNSLSKHFFVNVSKSCFDIVVIEKSKLLFNNSFNYNSKEDFIYYILFTAEQLQLNPEVFLVSFIGDINTDSELYKIAYQYIRNINFIAIETSFFDDYSEVIKHAYYTTIP